MLCKQNIEATCLLSNLFLHFIQEIWKLIFDQFIPKKSHLLVQFVEKISHKKVKKHLLIYVICALLIIRFRLGNLKTHMQRHAGTYPSQKRGQSNRRVTLANHPNNPPNGHSLERVSSTSLMTSTPSFGSNTSSVLDLGIGTSANSSGAQDNRANGSPSRSSSVTDDDGASSSSPLSDIPSASSHHSNLLNSRAINHLNHSLSSE